MKAEPTKKYSPFKILADFQRKGETQELEVIPSALNYAVLFEGKTLTKLSRRMGIRSWVQEEGSLLKDQVDMIGAAIESHYL